jgi:nucleotide-binding universal stress UspA family protein
VELCDTPTGTDRLLFSRILVATDFSPIARRALLYALFLARRYGPKIYVAHVIPSNQLESQGDPTRAHRVAEQQMEDLARNIQVNAESFTALIEAGEGALWVTIERLIHSHKIDLIVTGTRGLGPRLEPSLGSGAEQIFRHATCPVLTISPATGERDLQEMEFKSILYVTDFGPSAERALPYAVSIACKFDARLTFLHTDEEAPISGKEVHDHLRQIHTQRMKHALQICHPPGMPADFCVRFGNPVDETLGAAHELGAELLVMGAKATASWAGHVPLSTAYNIAARASCPVLTVRA